MDRFATVWMETEIGRGVAPRFGRLVKDEDDELVFHSMGLEHVQSIRVRGLESVKALTDNVVTSEASLEALEWWDNEYEIHLFNQTSLVQEPVLYGDELIFAIGWSDLATSNSYHRIFLNDSIELHRQTDDLLPSFKLNSDENIIGRIEEDCEPDVGSLENGLMKITLNVRPESGYATKDDFY